MNKINNPSREARQHRSVCLPCEATVSPKFTSPRMDDEYRALLEMFPGLPGQTLLSVWESCGGNFSAAVDEALTVASLENFNQEARVLDEPAATGVPQSLWDASPFQPGSAPTENGQRPPPSPLRGEGDSRDMVTLPIADSGSRKLPWENKERYVIGSGELGLLTELQMPRRGSIVPLPPDFLRCPATASAIVSPARGGGVEEHATELPAWAPEPLIELEPDGDRLDLGPVQLKPIVPSTRSPARTGADAHTPLFGERARTGANLIWSLEEPVRRGANVPQSLRGPTVDSAKEARPPVLRGGNDWVGDAAPTQNIFPTEETFVPGARIGKEAGASTKPSLRVGSNGWGAQRSPVVPDVETASAAHRIAAFSPGTRFRVAVDKGVTGLGITIKEIRGRFFVYRLQTLPDGSPGAAEEAGILAGDELLGVEELDFETERWDMDQLVSYMSELVGVVILHIMRGYGPLPRAPKSDEEKRMSHGVKQTDEGSPAGSEMRAGVGGRNGVHKTERRARRLLEVLEEEELSQPSEAADVSRLYCQIGDRARQWDSGELWLSVADMARRPSREVIAALASQWQPGSPAGWDESESSEGEPSPLSQNSLRNGRCRDSTSTAGRPRVGLNGKHDDPAAELDKIGTALLGQPLFSDPLSVGDELDTVGARRRSLQDSAREDNGHCWSPWPQLVALESKAARQSTVVPTQGLRKALNVRVLVDVPTANGNDPRTGSASQSSPYLVWVMDVESGAEWKVCRCHAEFAELQEVCTGMRPSLARLDFPSWLPKVKETPGIVEARRPRLEAYLQRLCSLLYMGPLHPSSAHVAHLLQDFLGTSPRVETLARLQKSRPERELRQALQVRAWQVLRLPPLERAVADFVGEVLEGSSSRSKKALTAEAILKKLTSVIERLQYVVTEGCFDEFREMVRASGASKSGANATTAGRSWEESRSVEGAGKEEGKGDPPDLDDLAAEDEALELISGSVRRQVEAEVFVPVTGRLYKLLRTEGETARQEKAVAAGIDAGKGKPQSFHGIPLKSLSPSSWLSSSKLLHTMGSFTLPCDKLDALVAVAHAIPALYRKEHPGDDAESLGADDFLPIFIFVLVNSKVEGMAAQAVILESLCDPKKMMGEAGFCVATLSAALQHLGRALEDQSRKGTMYNLLGGGRK